VIVVMGASSGIGRETARRAAQRGAKVVVAARSPEKLAGLTAEIQAAGGAATAVTADVTVPEQVQHVAEHAAATYGHIDTWAHVAGIGLWARLEETTPAEWQRVLDVNLNGPAHAAMAALPHLRREGRGALIFVSSVEARLALPYQSAYSASKHGVGGLVKVLRLELQHDGLPISVTEILPSGTNTPIFDQARTKIGVRPKPAPPIYQPGIVADAILRAAEHPTREMVLGGVSKAGTTLQGVAPALMDRYLLWTGFRTQRTRIPKSAAAPDNLFQPLAVYDTVEGSLGDQARPVSLTAWLEMRPALKRVLAGGLLGWAALSALQTLRERRTE